MPFFKLPLMLTTILVVAVSCKPNYEEKWKKYNQKYQPFTKTVKATDFERVTAVKFTPTGQNFTDGIIDMEIIDSTLILSSRIDSTNLTLININNFNSHKKLISKGKTRNKSLNISEIIQTEKINNFLAFDITLGKIFEFNLSKIIKGITEPEHIFEFNNAEIKGIKSPTQISDGTFAATSYFINDCRYLNFDSTGTLLKKIGELPPEVSGWPEATLENKISSMSYSSVLKKRNGSDEIAVAYTTTPRIEIYSHDKIKNIILGPDNFQPIYKFKKGAYPSPIETEETKFSHVKMKSDSQNFYTLYSGEGNYASCAQKILVFSWTDGSPKKIINLGRTVCNFAVKPLPGNKILLFVISKDNGDLLKAEIQI